MKKGPLENLRGRKSTLSGPHIPVPTFPLSTPPKGLRVDLTYHAHISQCPSGVPVLSTLLKSASGQN